MTAQPLEILRGLYANMPHMDHFLDILEVRSDLAYEVDLGSLLNFIIEDDEALVVRCQTMLEEVARICQGGWHWRLDQRTIYRFQPGSPTGDDLPRTPMDQRQILRLNFASKSDAMLVRMTLEGITRALDADG